MSLRLRAEASAVTSASDAILDEVLLRTLEPVIAGLNRLLDAAPSAAAELGEPDGFDGLDRRGHVERLLATDWLLATEDPDEFLRRYEHGELGFLRVARVEQHRPLASLVLFDAGPAQLGRPRVAQLASLVALSRRAEAAGAELRWGTLQQPARHTAADSRTFERFIRARSTAAPGELPLDAFVDDALVVSNQLLPTVAQQLRLTEDDAGLFAELIDNRTGRTRRAQLPMPAAADCIRILRDPTAQRPGSRIEVPRSPISNLVFDERGNKLLARIEANRLAIYPVPNSPNDKPGRIRYVGTRPADGVIAAAGRIKRSVITVNVVDGGSAIVVTSFGGTATGPTGRRELRGGVLETPSLEDPLGSMTWAESTLRVFVSGRRLTQLLNDYRVDIADPSLRWGSPGFDFSATPAEGGWTIRHGAEEWTYPDAEIVGVIGRWSRRFDSATGTTRASVVTIDDDRTALLATDVGGSVETLFRAGEEIIDATIHHRQPLYALRTASGRVVIRSWAAAGTLLEVFPQ